MEYYKNKENDKFIATDERNCMIILRSKRSRALNIYSFPFRMPGQDYIQSSKEEFEDILEEIDAIKTDFINKNNRGLGLSALLPDAKEIDR